MKESVDRAFWSAVAVLVVLVLTFAVVLIVAVWRI